jgi:site-specific recombinase XerD
LFAGNSLYRKNKGICRKRKNSKMMAGDYFMAIPREKEENHLNERSVQKIFEAACQNAKITKNVSVHSLRHYVESEIMGCAHLI